jgi:hypothetical protein
MEITTKVCTFYFYNKRKKLHLNYNKIPCFVEMKSNNKIKYVVYPKTKYVVFYYQLPTTLLISSKQCVPQKDLPFFHQIFPFWVVPSHIIMIQNQQEFKIQNYNVP